MEALHWGEFAPETLQFMKMITWYLGKKMDPRGLEPPTNRTGICHSIH